MIEDRKSEHVEICATKDVLARYNHWDDVFLIHDALPEINKSEIELKTKLFGKTLNAPIIISAMTGGYAKAKNINQNLAGAAAELQVGFGVGSQRPAVEDSKHVDTYTVVKDFDVPLVIGNLGVPQLIHQTNKHKPLTVEAGRTAMELIDADILAIHMNFLQEIVQPEGDTNAAGCLSKLKTFAAELPVLAKETGAGVSKKTAKLLKSAGVKGIDVGGYGGTSFAAVEMYRGQSAGDKLRQRMGKTFWDWGIPTPVSLIESAVGLPLIATGGTRDGLDAVKALCLGASSAGFAGRLLKPALKSSKYVINELENILEELRGGLFLIGAKNVEEANKNKVIFTGRTLEILHGLGAKL